MTGRTRLIGDIGGTNARFTIARDGAFEGFERYGTDDFPSLGEAIADYLDRVPAAERPHEAALSIAGPVEGETVNLTNHPAWSFSRRSLAEECGFDRVIAVNDFSAAAMGLPYLGPADLAAVGGGKARRGAPLAILGPGTGLGVGGLVPTPDGGWIPLAGEGGHNTMAAVDAYEDRILDLLRRRFDHVSAERVLSGEGLVNLYGAIAQLDGVDGGHPTPAHITESDEPLCRRAVDHFTAMLGTIAGNLALTLGAAGGVYIGGGIIPRLGKRFAESEFRRRFEAKGRFNLYLSAIPTWVITHPNPALVGLAHLP
ncbi:MAG TPA: glucokinase [Aliidongia sp.]|nr:glucokinase [Aliidongia sp.]